MHYSAKRGIEIVCL